MRGENCDGDYNARARARARDFYRGESDDHRAELRIDTRDWI